MTEVTQAWASSRDRELEDVRLQTFMFGCGALPWIAAALSGSGDQVELGVGILLMTIPLRNAQRALFARLRHERIDRVMSRGLRGGSGPARFVRFWSAQGEPGLDGLK